MDEINLPDVAAPSSDLLEQKANKIYNIGNIDKQINNLQLTDEQVKMLIEARSDKGLLSSQEQREASPFLSPDLPYFICRERFNIIILSQTFYDKGLYRVDHKVRFMERFTSAEIKDELKELDLEAIEKIRSYPTILASESRYHGYLGASGQYAQYGFIKDITRYEFYDEIAFIAINKRIPQKFFDEHLYELGLEGRPRCSEMTTTHWEVKQGDLISVLRKGGIRLDFPVD